MSNPNFALYPNNDDVGILQPIIPLGNNLTFARGSNKSRMNELGNIEILDSNRPALNFNNLNSCPKWSFEPQRTNLLPYSDTRDFSLIRAIRGTAQSYYGINGYFYSDDGNSSSNYKATSTTTQGYYTYSFYFDITTANTIVLRIGVNGDRVNGARVVFTSSTKTFSAVSENATNVRNSSTRATQWNGNIWRLELSTEIIATLTSVEPSFSLENNISNVWLGGAQLEKGDGATSLIETTGSQALRIVDSATLTNLFTKGLLTATAGAVYLEMDAEQLNRVSVRRLFDIGSTGNGAFRIFHPTDSQIFPYVSVKYPDATTSDYLLTQKSNKIIFNYSASNVDVWVNGTKVLSTGKAFALTNDTMTLSGAGRQFDLKTIAMWNSTQTDEFCQNLTTL